MRCCAWESKCDGMVQVSFGIDGVFPLQGDMTEWLRWWTRNPLGHSRVGSSPTVIVFVCN